MIKFIFWFSLIVVVYTYLGYPIVLYFVSFFYKKLPKKVRNFYPVVSLVISAYNEEKYIGNKIASLLNIEYPKDKIEFLFGSDGCTDNTAQIIQAHNDQSIKLYKFDKRMGKVNVLNSIVPKAKGEIIIFSDANTIFDFSAVRELVKYFVDPAVGCVCGKLVLKKPDGSNGGEIESTYWKYESFLKNIEGQMGALLGANGGIYAIRKELFQPLPSNTVIEDFVLPMKILEKGFKVTYAPDAIAFEETSKSISEEGKRKMRIGAGNYQALSVTLPMLNIFRGFPSFAYWSHKVIRWFVPFFLIALLLINLFLREEGIYRYLFYLQLMVYGGALMGYFLQKLKCHLKLFTVLYYFIAMNIALLIGFFRLITGSQQVTWERIDR